jgi:hypothetical protein
MFRYIDMLSKLWALSLKISDLPSLIKETKSALAAMELHFPTWDQDMNRHQVNHVSRALGISGPAWLLSMLPFERIWKKLIGWLHQKRHPESTMIANFLAMRSAMNAESFLTTSEGEGETCPHSISPALCLTQAQLQLQNLIWMLYFTSPRTRMQAPLTASPHQHGCISQMSS